MQPASPRNSANLPCWLAWLEHTAPSAIIDLTLDRVQAARQRLAISVRPTHISVAGTNGKGTVTTLIEHCAIAHNLRVGTLTSPHLRSFSERIRIDGLAIADKILAKGLQAIHTQCADLQLTFFEYNTLLAFWVFQQHSLDIIISEVGLGGRYDAVAAFPAPIAVITTIDLDHQQWLGGTIAKIAHEKAGIIAKNAIICSAAAHQAIRTAAHQQQAELRVFNQDFSLSAAGRYVGNNIIQVPMPAHFQPVNIALTLAACEAAQIKILSSSVDTVLATLAFPARQSRYRIGNSTVYIDCAHNQASIHALAKRQFPARAAIFTAMSDKVLQPFYQQFPTVEHWFITQPPSTRAMPLARLNAVFDGNAAVIDWQDIEQWLLAQQQPLLIFGSFLLAGKAMDVFDLPAIAHLQHTAASQRL